jgi:integral membrane protein
MNIKTSIGRLRIIGLLEGLSLIILVFLGMPLKYWLDYPAVVKIAGLIHGILFILFVLITFSVATTYDWKFFKTTWKVILASMIPFGMFYVDKKILSKTVE